MKRPARLAAVTVSVLAIVVAWPWVSGMIVEYQFREMMENFQLDTPRDERAIKFESYDRGYRRSTAFSSWAFGDRKQFKFTLRHDIFHGAFEKVAPNRVRSWTKPCLARVVTSWESPDLKKSPLNVEVTVSLTGDATIDGTLDPVQNHPIFRTDGGECRFFYSDRNDELAGNANIASLKFTPEAEGKIELSLDSLAFEIEPERQMSGSIGSFKFEKSEGESIEAEKLDFVYVPSLGGKQPALDSIEFTCEKLQGNFLSEPYAASGVQFSGGHRERDDSHSLDADLSFTSVEAGFLDATGISPYSPLVEKGLKVRFGLRLPHILVDAWKDFEPEASLPSFSAMTGSRIKLTSEQKKAAIRWIELTLENFKDDPEFNLHLKIGDSESFGYFTANYHFSGTAAVTEYDTVADLLLVNDVMIAIGITKETVENSPAIEEELRFLIAEGTLREEGDLYVYRSTLENGELSVDGEPNRMLQQLEPLLQQEIQWEDAFLGE